MYEVTLRRDVQQKIVFRVAAPSSKDAIDTAEAAATGAEDTSWQVEELIAAHRPKVASALKADAAREQNVRTAARKRGSP
jgi:hypothetical protein